MIRCCRVCWTGPTPWTKRSRWTSICQAARRTRTRSAKAIVALLEGRAPQLPTKSVCDTCPTIREGKGKVKKVRRFIQNAHFEPGRPLSEMHCLLEQGYRAWVR